MLRNSSNQMWLLLTLIVVTLLPMPGYGQGTSDTTGTGAPEKRFHFGYGFGLNVMGLSAISNPGYVFQAAPHVGINVHVAVSFHLNRRVDLGACAGILLNQRDILVLHTATSFAQSFKVESNLLELPIMMKYKFLPDRNRNTFLLLGLSPKFDLGGNEIAAWQPAIPLLSRFDVYPEIGFGVEYRLRKLKFGAELKFSLGLLDVHARPADPKYNVYAAGIRKSHSRLITLGFNFE